MNQEPPDIETCKRIINSAELRAGHSIRGGIGRLAIAGVLILFAFSTGDVEWFKGSLYLNLKAILSLFLAIIFIWEAYVRVFGTKDGRVLVWFANDYLSRHIVEVATQHAKQHAEQIADGKPPKAPQPPH